MSLVAMVLAILASASTALAHPAPRSEGAGQARSAVFQAFDRPGPAVSPHPATSGEVAPTHHVDDSHTVSLGRNAEGSGGWQGLLAPGGEWRGLLEPGGAVAWLVIGLVTLVGVAPRRMAAGLAVLAIAVLAFETGVHSVHHLGDEAGASQCSVASASTQLSGTLEDGPGLRVPVPATADLVSVQLAPAVAAPARYDAIRGPPGPLRA